MNLTPQQIFRPMKGIQVEEKDYSLITWPKIVQPKIDGIRCVIKDGLPHTAQMKLIPNRKLRDVLGFLFDNWFLIDGELTIGDSFQDTVSCVMSKNEELPPGKSKYYIFDGLETFGSRLIPFKDRIVQIQNLIQNVVEFLRLNVLHL